MEFLEGANKRLAIRRKPPSIFDYRYGLPIAMLILSYTAVPLFRKAGVYTAYEFLEQRFDSRVRALVLTGGGARGAYQAGALRAIAAICAEKALPFPIVSGVSAGATTGVAVIPPGHRIPPPRPPFAGGVHVLTKCFFQRTSPVSTSRA